MTIEPSNRTAAIAGAWAASGMVPFEAWFHAHPATPAILKGSLFLFMLAIFLFVPGIYLVNGRGSVPFKRMWFRDPEERARFATASKRTFVWFVSAAATGVLWSILLPLLLPAR